MTKRNAHNVESIEKLRALFPRQITVRVTAAEEGGFVAEVIDIPGVITEGDTFSELIEMINDAMQTVLEIPRMYTSQMPFYLPPIELARQFDVMPPVRERNLTLVSSRA